MATKTKQKSTKTQSSKSTKGVIASSKKFSLSRKQWAVVAVIVVAVAGIGTYLGVQMYQDTTTGAASCVSKTYNEGDSGSCVKHAQTLLNYKIAKNAPNIAKLSTDGSFGPKTKAAVKAFQKYWQLSQTSTINKSTWGSLCSAQMGYTDSKGVDHGVWTSKTALDAARAAGCSVKNDVVQ